MTLVPTDLTHAAVKEFYELLLKDHDASFRGSRDFLHHMLNQSVSEEIPEAPAQEASRKISALQILETADSGLIQNAIEHESAHTIAMMMLFLEPERSAKLLSTLELSQAT